MADCHVLGNCKSCLKYALPCAISKDRTEDRQKMRVEIHGVYSRCETRMLAVAFDRHICIEELVREAIEDLPEGDKGWRTMDQ